ncbi:MAG: hypothetical protein CSA76_04185 [Spirochaetales bacterium]|nr:MAG: hypothetical protein CSA76_04185 [Spirochaetales bacterium]
MPNSIHVDTRFTAVSAAGRSVRPGDVVSVRVAEVLPGNRFRILLGGRSLNAGSSIPLRAGQIIRAQVDRSGPLLRLRILQPEVSRPSLPSSQTAALTPKAALTAAFLKAAMALPAESVLNRMSALLGRANGSRKRLARLYADLVSRGAEPSADFLEAVDELFHGSREGGQEGGREGGGFGGENKNRHSGWKEPPSASQCQQDFSEDKDEQAPLIHLINQTDAKGDTWQFRRSRRRLGEDTVDLTWKIRQGSPPAMALTVQDGARRLEFLLEGLQPVNLTVYASENTEIPSELWNNFCERISLKNIQVNGTIQSMELSDGFSSDSGEAV